MAKTKTKKVDVLKTLQDARHHIDTKWIHGAWFKYNDDDDGGSGSVVPEGATVVGICAAGSVLYTLDYTDEQWTSKDDVKPVMEALYEALPPRTQAAKNAKKTLEDLDKNPYSLDKNLHAGRVYDVKVDAIITFNDQKGRCKHEVLALFDQAIENVRAATPLTIQEETL